MSRLQLKAEYVPTTIEQVEQSSGEQAHGSGSGSSSSQSHFQLFSPITQHNLKMERGDDQGNAGHGVEGRNEIHGVEAGNENLSLISKTIKSLPAHLRGFRLSDFDVKRRMGGGRYVAMTEIPDTLPSRLLQLACSQPCKLSLPRFCPSNS